MWLDIDLYIVYNDYEFKLSLSSIIKIKNIEKGVPTMKKILWISKHPPLNVMKETLASHLGPVLITYRNLNDCKKDGFIDCDWIADQFFNQKFDALVLSGPEGVYSRILEKYIFPLIPNFIERDRGQVFDSYYKGRRYFFRDFLKLRKRNFLTSIAKSQAFVAGTQVLLRGQNVRFQSEIVTAIRALLGDVEVVYKEYPTFEEVGKFNFVVCANVPVSIMKAYISAGIRVWWIKKTTSTYVKIVQLDEICDTGNVLERTAATNRKKVKKLLFIDHEGLMGDDLQTLTAQFGEDIEVHVDTFPSFPLEGGGEDFGDRIVIGTSRNRDTYGYVNSLIQKGIYPYCRLLKLDQTDKNVWSKLTTRLTRSLW